MRVFGVVVFVVCVCFACVCLFDRHGLRDVVLSCVVSVLPRFVCYGLLNMCCLGVC